MAKIGNCLFAAVAVTTGLGLSCAFADALITIKNQEATRQLSPKELRLREIRKLPYEDWAVQEGYRLQDVVLQGLLELNCGSAYQNATAHGSRGSIYNADYSPQEGLTLDAVFRDTRFSSGTVEYKVNYSINEDGIPVPRIVEYIVPGTNFRGSNPIFGDPFMLYSSGADPQDQTIAYGLMFYKEGAKGLTAIFEQNKEKHCRN